MAATAAPPSQVPYRQIRALYDDTTITVYQAYNRQIAAAAVAEQRLHASPQFRPSRMTWIKPSWAWMMYRAGYSYKDPGQERILALRMKHADFVGLLEKAVLTFGHGNQTAPSHSGSGGADPDIAVTSTADTSVGTDGAGEAQAAAKKLGRPGDPAAGKSPDVKVQWDPERTVRLAKLEYRSIQIGIPAAVSPEWTDKWIVSIEDVTERARSLKRVLDERPDVSDEELVGMGLLPAERPFEIPEHIQRSLGMILE